MGQLADQVGDARQRAQIVSSASRVLTQEGELDQEARDAAKEALGRISAHEVLCTERWNQQREALLRLEVTLAKLSDAMNSRVGWIPASIIMVLIAAVGWLSRGLGGGG